MQHAWKTEAKDSAGRATHSLDDSVDKILSLEVVTQMDDLVGTGDTQTNDDEPSKPLHSFVC